MPQLKQSGATLHTVATLPPGTLVIYTYMQQGKCGTAYGMASQQQGLWHASSAGMSVGSCPIPGVGPAIWSMGHFGGSRQPGSGWTAALGQIRDTTVASVEVHWDDGAVTVATISQDMFYTYHPASAEIVSVVAYDTGGNVLETVPRP